MLYKQYLFEVSVALSLSALLGIVPVFVQPHQRAQAEIRDFYIAGIQGTLVFASEISTSDICKRMVGKMQ